MLIWPDNCSNEQYGLISFSVSVKYSIKAYMYIKDSQCYGAVQTLPVSDYASSEFKRLV